MKTVVVIHAYDGESRVTIHATASIRGLTRHETKRVKRKLADRLIEAVQGTPYTDFSILDLRAK